MANFTQNFLNMCSYLNKNLVVFLLAFMLSGFFGSITCALAQDLVMRKSELSFGEVLEGQVLEEVVEIVNQSESPIAIVQAIPECGCMVVDFKSVTLAPSSSLKTKVKFFTEGFYGHIRKSITFLTSSTTTPELAVTLTGKIIPSFEIAPSRIVFPDQLSSVNSPKIILKIKSTRARPHSLRVRTLSSNILVNKLKDKTGSIEEYSIQLISPLPEGDFSSAISIRTNEKGIVGKTVPVYSRIVGPLEIERNVLPFGLVEKNKIYTRDVKLKVISPQLTIDPSKIETSCDCLSTKLQMGKNGEYVLRVSLDSSKTSLKRLAETIKIFVGEVATVLRVSAYVRS